MNETIKRLLTPPLLALTKSVDNSAFLQKVLRYAPFPRKTAIVRRLLKFSPDKTIANCRGVKFELDTKDLLQREIYFNTYDAQKLPLLLKHLKSGGIYLDIGANIGFYALHMAKHLKGYGKVYAVEADPSIFQSLAKNCAMNSFGKLVTPFNLAISNCNARLNFYTHDGENSGAGSLTSFDHIHGKKIEVDAVTLDQFLEKEKISRVDFLKVDIEAHEFELLEGAKQALKTRQLRKIYVEFNGVLLAQKGKTFRDFLDAFAEYGYVPADINLDLAAKLKTDHALSSEICSDFLFS
jgi:FkbM family methyltransferase